MPVPFCLVHPEIETGLACQRCGRPFCQACLADLMGGCYCAPCKTEVVRGMQRGPERSSASIVALVLSIVSLFLCGALALILSSVTIYLGFRALGEAERLRPGGRHDLEWAAVVISGSTLVLWTLGFGLGVLVWARA